MNTQALVPIESVAIKPKPAKRDIINAMVERRYQQIVAKRTRAIEAVGKRGEQISDRLLRLVRKHVRELKPRVSLGYAHGESLQSCELSFPISDGLLKQLDAALRADLIAHLNNSKVPYSGSEKELREQIREEVSRSLGDTGNAEARVGKILADKKSLEAIDDLLARIYE